MLELSIGLFLLIALGLAFRENVPSPLDWEDVNDLFVGSEVTLEPFPPKNQVLLLEPEVFYEDIIEEMISIQAEAVEAVSSLATDLSTAVAHELDPASLAQYAE